MGAVGDACVNRGGRIAFLCGGNQRNLHAQLVQKPYFAGFCGLIAAVCLLRWCPRSAPASLCNQWESPLMWGIFGG